MWDDPNTTPARDAAGHRRPPYGQDAPGGWGTQNQPPAQPHPGAPGFGQSGAYNEPPPYEPSPPPYPGGQPPQWPGPSYNRPPTQPAMPPGTPPQYPVEYREPAYPAEYPPARAPRENDAPRSRQYARDAAYAPPRRETAEHRRRAITGVALPHLPIAHVFLAVGLLAMGYALTQQWGVDGQGAAIFVKDFTSPRIQHQTGVDTGVAAANLAVGIVIAAAALSAVMVLFNLVVTVLNKILGIVGLSGCASLLFFPVLWGAGTLLFLVLVVAAGFAGLGFLSGLPIVQAHGFSTLTVAHYSLGWYLWLGGIGALFLGMLGQLVMRRR